MHIRTPSSLPRVTIRLRLLRRVHGGRHDYTNRLVFRKVSQETVPTFSLLYDLHPRLPTYEETPHTALYSAVSSELPTIFILKATLPSLPHLFPEQLRKEAYQRKPRRRSVKYQCGLEPIRIKF